MAVTKTPTQVVEGSPPDPSHEVVNRELRLLLDEMRTETAAAIDGVNRLANADRATTENITLSGEQTIDGGLTAASRVLVKDQTATAENGIYVSAAGAWARAGDANTSAKLAFAYARVSAGTASAGKSFAVAGGPVLGTDAVTWVQVDEASNLAAHEAAANPHGTTMDDIGDGVAFKRMSAAEKTKLAAIEPYGAAELTRERQLTSVAQGRPGELLDRYTTRRTGDREGDPVTWPIVVGARGRALRITGDAVVALRDRIAVSSGQVFTVRADFERQTDPTDPSGATVRITVQWLDQSYAAVSQNNVFSETLTVAMGQQLVSLTIGAAGTDADLEAPAGAVYAVLFVETFDVDGVTDVYELALDPSPLFASVAGVADKVVVTPASDNAAYFPTFVPSADPGARAVRVDADLTYNPSTNTLGVPNIVTDTLDAQSITLPSAFTFERDNIPDFPVARTFYVTMDGSDSAAGTSTSKPFRTIARVLTAMQAAAPNPCVAIVHPGEYLVPRDSVIAANCALYGYDLRVTRLILADAAGTGPATSAADRRQNMFRMRSGIKVRGFSFTGMEHEPYTFSPSTEQGAPPQKGFAFVFNPGEIIFRSPYIADCTVIHDLTQDQLSLPIDRAAGNPLMPRGAGNLFADGSVLGPSSPLRSVVVDSFTAVNPNGVGYAITRNGFVQLVSVFTNWSRVGIWAHDGGQVTLANSNSTFGDYAFAASGSRLAILIPDGTVDGIGVFTAAADTIQANFAQIVSNLMNIRYPATLTGWATFTTEQRELTERDTETLLKELIGDLRAGQERGIQRFTKGLFDWNAEFVFAPTLLTPFLQAFDQINLELQVFVTASAPRTMFANLINLIKVVLQDPATYRVPFVSVVEFASQAFSYSGAGVNYNSLPFSQRGTGILPDPISTIVQRGGGRCYGTFSTERGDTYLGNDLRVDFERSTVEGQAFSRGVQNIALPLIISLGG
jgi:hypothetical protein